MTNKIVLKLGNPLLRVGVTPVPIQPDELPVDHADDPATTAALSKSLQDAYDVGLAEGLARGRQEGKTWCDALSRQVAVNLEAQWHAFLAQLEPELAALAIKIVEQFLLKNRESGNYDIERVVAQAIAELNRMPGLILVAIHCHPDDLLTLHERPEQYCGIELVADAQVAKGDCLIKTNLGRAVVTLADRIKQLQESFAKPAAPHG